MKLSVALRVILGFGSITALLLFAGISSLMSLNTVSQSQHQLTDIADPITADNRDFRLQLAMNRELLLESYYQQSSNDLARTRSHFQQSTESLEQAFHALEAKIQRSDLFGNVIEGLSPLLDRYEGQADKAIQHRSNYLAAKESSQEAIDLMSSEADDSSSYLLDLMDYAEGAESKAEQALVSVANQLEAAITASLAANQDILTMDNVKQLEVAESKLGYLSEELNGHLAKLKAQADSFSEPDLLTDAIKGAEGILTKYLTQQRILKLQQQQITEKQRASEQLTTLSQTTDELISQQYELNQQIQNFSQQAQQAVLHEVASGRRINSIIMGLSVILALTIGIVVVRSIIRPLNEVNSMLNVIASGDLTQRLDVVRNDEFGELSNNVNVLIDNLRELINGILERSTQLGAAAEQTSAVTRQSTESMQQQRNMIEQVATATTEMSSTSQQVVNSAGDTLAAVKHADDEAEHVKQLAGTTRATMMSLAKEVKQASDVINQLHGDSTSISSILDVIRGIAEQTNLLALNAAIEAARAGEQGRGFAVVADEVRSLASRTQESTQEINNMIEKLQAGAQQAVTVMAQGQDMAEQCVKQVEDSTNALQIITDSVHHAHDISSQINQAALEQTDVTRQISQQLEQIVAIAEDSADGARQTAAASQQVAHLSAELKSSIQRFTV